MPHCNQVYSQDYYKGHNCEGSNMVKNKLIEAWFPSLGSSVEKNLSNTPCRCDHDPYTFNGLVHIILGSNSIIIFVVLFVTILCLGGM